MKTSLLALIAALEPTTPAFADSFVLPPQGESAFADTEVSTNIAIRTSRTNARDVTIQIWLAGTPTNALEVAFGRDANANGTLEADETETVYGWRGGRYFVESVRDWTRIEAEAATDGPCGDMDIQLKNNAELVPKRVAAICGGNAAFPELATRPPPPWLFRETWDMMRVTRRGAGVPSEWVRCEFDYKFFIMSIR